MENWQNQIITFSFSTLGLIVAAVVPYVGKWIAKKFKVDAEGSEIDNQRRIIDELQRLAQWGISYAEEQARKKAKAGEATMAPSEKLDCAVGFLIASLKDLNLPAQTADALKSVIEAQLNKGR